MSVFVAWMPGDDARDDLLALADAIRARAPGIRAQWRKPAQLHMTVRHLGETLPPDPAPFLAAISRACAAARPTALRFDRIESWPGANVLVARAEATPEVLSLFGAIEDAAVTCGFRRERAAKPHVTLAYAARRGMPVPDALRGIPVLPPLPFIARVDALALARTIPGGYACTQRWPLGAEAASVDAHVHPR